MSVVRMGMLESSRNVKTTSREPVLAASGVSLALGHLEFTALCKRVSSSEIGATV
jgi:hypothetical protein